MVAATFGLVGQKAGGRLHVLRRAEVGAPVTLVPEPHNKFDKNAIAVHLGPPSGNDSHLGYMPKDIAARFHLPNNIEGTISHLRYPPGDADDLEPGSENLAVGADISVEGLHNYRRGA